MEAYVANLSVLKEKNAYIYNLVTADEDIVDSDDSIEDIQILQSVDRHEILELVKARKKFRMNSMYSLEYETEEWLAGIDFYPMHKVFVFMGFGNGHYISRVMEKLQEDDIIILYEPSLQLFKFVLQHFYVGNILENEKFHLFLGEKNLSDLKNYLRSEVCINNISSQKVMILPQYERLFRNELNLFMKTVSDSNKSVMLAERTNAALSMSAIKNTFRNLKYLRLCNCINDYINRFPENIPAIIVAAGPSLRKNIEQLRKAKGRAVIFAVDRALEFLYKADIIPDYAVLLDPQKQVDMFANGYSVEIPLFTGLDSKSEILDLHKGKKIWYKTVGFIDSVLYNMKKGIYQVDSYGGSVATAAFSICIQMGFTRIILVGQDLAYAEDGKTSHAGEKVQAEAAWQDMWVEGVDGKKVKTRLDWYEFLTWYNNSMKYCLENDIRVIDATEGGAKIEGTNIMKLSEAIETYCCDEIDVSKIESTITPFFSDRNFVQIERYIDNGIKELKQMKKKAFAAEKICDRMIGKVKRKSTEDKTGHKLMEELTKANEFMAFKSIYPLVDQYITKESQNVMKNIYQINEDKDKNMEDSFIYSKAIYKLIQEAADDLTEIINNNFIRWSSRESKSDVQKTV